MVCTERPGALGEHARRRSNRSSRSIAALSSSRVRNRVREHVGVAADLIEDSGWRREDHARIDP